MNDTAKLKIIHDKICVDFHLFNKRNGYGIDC